MRELRAFSVDGVEGWVECCVPLIAHEHFSCRDWRAIVECEGSAIGADAFVGRVFGAQGAVFVDAHA
jgi:hypothetical protein